MDLTPLLAALVAHQWTILAALSINLFIALAKQGWFSTWVASKLPASILPFVAVALGSLGAVATDLLQGLPWNTSLLAGVSAAFAAIVGHQIVNESMRKGVELIPCAPWAKPPANDVAKKAA
jgi:hypothetical protein